MELIEFLRQTQSEVRAEIAERVGSTVGGGGEQGAPYPYPESVFAEIVMQHMAEIGMTFEPQICHYSAKIGNAMLKLSGFSISEDADQLDLFVCLYANADELAPIADAETKAAAEQCFRFLAKCVSERLADKMDPSNDAYALATTIQGSYNNLDQIRIYVLTDRQAKAKNFNPREIVGKTVKLEVMDIERLYRHWSAGTPRDELVVNFEQVSGQALPCVYVPGESQEYDYALTVIPGETLRFVYDKYGARLLEANVRSFLSATGKVNKGIRDTLKSEPERFMAYNNGIVVVADEAGWTHSADGGAGLLWLKGMQIVNGGQTTASIYFTKKRDPTLDLRLVRVPAKIIVMKSKDPAAEEALISDISRFANSQNSVKQSDLSANKPFHVEMEKLALSTYCPDGVGRWFYERAAGSYNTMLAREGGTPAQLRKLREAIPPARKITKTDLAKYLNVWDRRPDLVSLGSQKNFEKFMEAFRGTDDSTPLLPDVVAYKMMVAKAIVFKKAQALIRPSLPAFQANVVAYTIALVADRAGASFSFDQVWDHQDISPALKTQLQAWATEVSEVLNRSASGRMVSEWAKKPECWSVVKDANYSPLASGIRELA
jgi:hypothetical protein